MTEPLRVVIAAAHAPSRASIRGVLEDEPGVTVCAEALDAASAVGAAIEHKPDVCLLDMAMPGGGIAATWEITARLPDTAVIMLSDSNSDSDLFAALRAGASGYLLKDMDGRRLPDTLRAVARGEAALPPALVARVIAQFRDPAPLWRSPIGGHAAPRLTSREWQILKLIREGLTTNQIARRLSLTAATIRSHRAHIIRKLAAVPGDEADDEAAVEPSSDWGARFR